ncbi:MAG: hypothetical protein P8X82_04165 [Gemmatimonadales bacterium]
MDLRAWLETIGIIGVIVSLLLLGYELRLTRDASMAERFTAAAEVEASIRDSIAANADVWQRGCVGDDLSVTDRTVFNNLVWAYTFRYFMRWHTDRLLVGAGGGNVFVDGVATNVRDYPGFRRAWISLEWARDYVDAVESRLKVLGPPTPDPDPANCGI